MASNPHYSDDEEGYIDDDLSEPGAELSPEEQEAVRQQKEAAHQAAKENAALLEQVPDPVKKFVIKLNQALSAGNTSEVSQLYDRTWPALSNEFYKAEEWPRAEVLSSLVRNDEVFLTFYRELYFRHLYSRFAANIDIDDRFDSYENYCNLFNYILNSEGPVPIELPTQWLWDIIDEFIWQFSAFATWRAKTKDKTPDEIELLEESPQVWSSYSVLNVLYSLIQKSHIHEYLSTKKNQGAEAPADDFAGKPLYRLFGYFSILGLLRVHVLLGDFTLALAVMDGFDLKAMLSPATRMHAVHAAHVSALYHVGFCYLMLNRWTDAIDVLSRGVSYFYKNRRFTSGADQVAKTVDRMLAMIAIAHSFVPSLRLEDWIKSGVDKFGDGPHRINRGSYASGQSADELLSIYEDLFIRAAPKFVSPTPPALDAAAVAAANGDQESESGSNSGASTTDPTKHQLSLFLADIKPLLPAHDMRSFLRLYTTVSTEKLASLLNRNEEEVAQELAVVNGASRCPKWTEGSLLSGEAEPISDLAFQIEDGNVRISESKRQRQVADYFYRRTLKTADALHQLQLKPLPTGAALASLQNKQQQQQQQQKTGGAKSEGQKVTWSQNVAKA